MTRLHRLALVLVGVAALSGCSSDPGERETAVGPVDKDLADFQRPDGSIARVGDLFEANRSDEQGSGAMPINRYLWRASLDTLEFLPLASTDPFTGVIVTDWSTPPESKDERFKVTVFLESPELQAGSLRVAVFREVRAEDGGWTSAEVSEATPRRLEDAILTKARQLRVAELEAEAEG